MSDLKLKQEIKKIMQEHINPACDITPLFALCDVLGIKARTVASHLSVTPSQLSHYRKGATPVPLKRMQDVSKLLNSAIKELEAEIKLQRAKRLKPIQLRILDDFESRLNLAKKINELDH